MNLPTYLIQMWAGIYGIFTLDIENWIIVSLIFLPLDPSKEYIITSSIFNDSEMLQTKTRLDEEY